MKVTKREHKIYKEYQAIKHLELSLPKLVGQWQYLYKSDDGKKEISLVELFGHRFENYKDRTTPTWEIFSLKGELIDDVERFDTKDQAEVRIKELLE